MLLLLHLEDAVRMMEGRFDGSHMARHTLEMHPGEQPKFGMTIVRTYTSAFTLAMGENPLLQVQGEGCGITLSIHGFDLLTVNIL